MSPGCHRIATSFGDCSCDPISQEYMKTLLHLFTAVSLLVAINARAQLAITETLSSAFTNKGKAILPQSEITWTADPVANPN